jgi:predicted RNA-binding Zn-ribbon protein involved in translation (DUF1610 family)
MNQKFTPEQVRRYQNRDKRIMTQSTLKAILGDKGIPELTPAACDSLLNTVFYIVEKIAEEYPTDDDMEYSEKMEYLPEPFPSKKATQLNTQTVEYPAHCPECGADVKNKSGVSKKTGKPYSFVGCSAYPECRWIFK